MPYSSQAEVLREIERVKVDNTPKVASYSRIEVKVIVSYLGSKTRSNGRSILTSGSSKFTSRYPCTLNVPLSSSTAPGRLKALPRSTLSLMLRVIPSVDQSSVNRGVWSFTSTISTAMCITSKNCPATFSTTAILRYSRRRRRGHGMGEEEERGGEDEKHTHLHKCSVAYDVSRIPAYTDL